ncbi:MAG: hydrogenase maturation peptidase HycI [Candidatus Omnitrophica bacterium]|nr:hydrogenase maturation peptidase HycI [Candidatus Omnitrophota bacterium]
MPLAPDNTKEQLSKILSGKVLIVGIGNSLRGDDSFGPALTERIEGKVKANCLDAGSSPENYIGKIIKLQPDVILLIDAVSMDKEAGYMRLIKADEIPQYGFSTHNVSPRLMIENIKEHIKAEIFMLGIQPKNLEFGSPLSEELHKKLLLLENTFIEIMGSDENKK